MTIIRKIFYSKRYMFYQHDSVNKIWILQPTINIQMWKGVPEESRGTLQWYVYIPHANMFIYICKIYSYIYLRFSTVSFIYKINLNLGVWKNDNWWKFTAIYTSYILLIQFFIKVNNKMWSLSVILLNS